MAAAVNPQPPWGLTPGTAAYINQPTFRVTVLCNGAASGAPCNGMESRPHKAHQIERDIFHIVRNFKVRRRVRRGSRTWSIILQLQTGHNFLTHAQRNGAPPTTDANTL